MNRNTEEIALVSKLLNESKLYKSGKDFMQLLDFVNRLTNFAPFNAFLLHIQKPGMRFAASELDWHTKFGRRIKEGARPLIILWPFSPVALVYDCDDTDGDKLPDSIAHAFKATGGMNEYTLRDFFYLTQKQGINVKQIEYGEAYAGHIQRSEHTMTISLQSIEAKQKPDYQIRLNKKHDINTQFATLAHELAHLYLGHLGKDKYLKIPDRHHLSHETRELEAETVCYIVCNRNNVKPNSAAYLYQFVTDSMRVEDMDLYAILKAAGHIETLLGLATTTAF